MKPIPPQPKPKRLYEPAIESRRGIITMRGRLALLVCSKCKNEQAIIIAYGFNAEELTQEGACRAGQAMAWQTAPRLLCPFCKPEKSYYLYHHPASNCIFWSNEQAVETTDEFDSLGVSKIKTRESAKTLFAWHTPSLTVEQQDEYFANAYNDTNAPENPNKKGQR